MGGIRGLSRTNNIPSFNEILLPEQVCSSERWIHLDTGGVRSEMVYSISYSIVYSVDFAWYKGLMILAGEEVALRVLR